MDPKLTNLAQGAKRKIRCQLIRGVIKGGFFEREGAGHARALEVRLPARHGNLASCLIIALYPGPVDPNCYLWTDIGLWSGWFGLISRHVLS